MDEKQWRRKSARRYPTYEPYPVSFGPDEDVYADSSDIPGLPPEAPEKSKLDDAAFDDDSSLPDWFDAGQVRPDDEIGFKPFRLLQSIFSERLSFLERSLYELDMARNERQQMTDKALEEIDHDIAECMRYLSVIKGILNNRERKRELERKVTDLKRERRHIELSSWRDVQSVQMQSRRLKQELDSLSRTGSIQGDSCG